MSQLGKLDETDARLTSSDVLRRLRTPQSQGIVRIEDKEELLFGQAKRHLLAMLHDLTRQPTPIDLLIEFECEPVYVHGLALLAAWCERYAARVRLSAQTSIVEQYLERTQYKRVVEGRVTIDAPLYDGENYVALTKIDREDREAADQIAMRLVDLFGRQLRLRKTEKRALTVMFAELVENVYRHANSTFPSFVMAQAFPRTQKLHVVVAD
ncbi:MAG: hypothetical protein JSU63_06485, partial [Phycisphaerales bacterium]